MLEGRIAAAEDHVHPGGVLSAVAARRQIVDGRQQPPVGGQGLGRPQPGGEDSREGAAHGRRRQQIGGQAVEEHLVVLRVPGQPGDALLQAQHVAAAQTLHRPQAAQPLQAGEAADPLRDHQRLHALKARGVLGPQTHHGAWGGHRGPGPLDPEGALFPCLHGQISSLCSTSLMAHTGTSGSRPSSPTKTKAAS